MVGRQGVLLGLLGLAAAAAGAAAQGYESLDDMMARYRDYVAPLRALPREERAADALLFFKDVTWDHIRYLCRQDSPGVAGESDALRQDLVKSKLHSEDEPQVEEMIAMLDDPLSCIPCQRAVVSYTAHMRGDLRETLAGEDLAAALLRRADAGDLPREIGFVLEQGASFLSAAPQLLHRASAHCRSSEDRRVELGLRMLGDSPNPAATDSILTMVDFLLARQAPLKAQSHVLRLAGEHGGALAFGRLQDIHAAAAGPLRAGALRGLAATQDQRSHSIILAAYGDQATGIVDSTHAIADAQRRKFFYEMWFLVRLAEPGLIRTLSEGYADAARLVISLLDRASRFGVPSDFDGVYAALEAWVARLDEAGATQVKAILARYREYPNRRAQGGQ